MPATLEPPSAPSSPAPSSPEPTAQFADFDAAFPDSLDSVDATPPPKTESIAPAEPKPDTTKQVPSKPTDKPTEKPVDKPAEEPVSEPGDEYSPPTVAKPSDLRGWALRMGKKAKLANDQVEQLQQRVRQLESQPPKEMEASGHLAQELAEAKKKISQYEADLQITKYERSGDYREKYQVPYQNAVQRAYREVKELIAYEPNPEDPDNPRERAATQADFDEIYALPLGQASRLAKQKFGDAAMIVLQHRQQIRQLSEAAYAAVEEHKGKAAQIETETKAQQAQREQGMLRMFTAASEMHAKKNPDAFLPKDGDNEGNELLSKGKQFAQVVFSGNDGLTPQQIAMRDARAFNWLSAFPRLNRDVRALQTKLAEANKTIEELRSSGPGKPKAAVETAPKTATSWEDDFEANVK